MTYKETLFFIGKCLTISLDDSNKTAIENQLKNEIINWDTVVKVSTAQVVFPALYCNFKRAGFLHYLPEELVNYMKHITDLNRDRNKQLITQAEDLNNLLLTNNITPIFLKGTANLLDGLYEDIAERMVGDIDLLIDINVQKEAIKCLKKDGYKHLEKSSFINESHRHYPRLIKDNYIGAIEVHHDMLNAKGNVLFNYNFVKNSLSKKGKFTLLNKNNQLLLNILSEQINDAGHLFKRVSLRTFYDTYLMSKKTDTLKAIETLQSALYITNSHLAITATILNATSSINYTNNKEAKKHVVSALATLDNGRKNKLLLTFLKLKSVISTIITSPERKDYFIYMLKRVFNKN